MPDMTGRASTSAEISIVTEAIPTDTSIVVTIVALLSVIARGLNGVRNLKKSETAGNLRQPPRKISSSAATISPDGKYLAYVEKDGGLFLSSIDTGEIRVLTQASGDIVPMNWYPGWDPAIGAKNWGPQPLESLSADGQTEQGLGQRRGWGFVSGWIADRVLE